MTLRVFAPADAALAALFLLILTMVALSGLLATEGESGFVVQSRSQDREGSGREMSRSASDVRLNPNRAGAAVLATLPGADLTLAEAIVRFRQVHGPFRSLSELERVPGVGSSRLEKMLPYLTLGEEATWSIR